MTTADPARGVPVSERSGFWSRALRGWDVAFYLMMVIGAAALALTDSPRDRATLGQALALMVVLVLAYTAIGRRAARTGDTRLAGLYLLVLVVLVVALVRVNPVGSLLLFIAYSQVWFFAGSRRAGVLVSTALSAGVVWSMIAYQRFDPDVVPQALAQGALGLAFAVLLGLWITAVAEQSEERAELLTRLEATQSELARTNHAAGVTAERERLAREIHDTLAQGFTSIVMLSQTALADLDRGTPERAAERLRLVERTARENLAEARALVAAFSPVGLEGSSLAEALGRLAERFEQETGVRVDVVVGEAAGESLARDREVVLLRAAQEALTNVRRHAQAGHVQLALDEDAGAIHLEVVDDGRGIDPGSAEGFGLRGMRERVTSGGGRLDVSPRDGGGTRVRVSLPRQGEREDAEVQEAQA